MQEEMREDLEQTGDVVTDVMGLLGESGMCVYVCAEGPRGHGSQKSMVTTINRQPRPQLDIIKDF